MRNIKPVSRFKCCLPVTTGIVFVTLLTGLPNVRQTLAAVVKAQLVRDVDNPADAPFEGVLPAGGSLAVPTTTPDGRAVKRLVIEFVSGHCSSQPGTVLFQVSVGTQLIQGNATYTTGYFFIPTQTFDDGGARQYAFTQQTRLYADPGTSILPGFGSSGAFYSCDLTFSGYFVTQ